MISEIQSIVKDFVVEKDCKLCNIESIVNYFIIRKHRKLFYSR